MDEEKKPNKVIDEIIYPEIEPGIISKAMIETAYLETGYVGEMARLHQMEPVVYDRITDLRLEQKSRFHLNLLESRDLI